MLVKSVSMNNFNRSMHKKTNSFSDFHTLILGGGQKILTFGEYSNKKNTSKINKRKVIMYFYKNMSN